MTMKLTAEALRKIIKEEVEATNQASGKKMTKGDIERLRSKKSPSMDRGPVPRLRRASKSENSRDDFGTERIGSVRFYVENGELLANWNLGELGAGNDSPEDWKKYVEENCDAMIDAARRYYSDIIDE